MKATCVEDDCNRPVRSRGMCHGHYKKWLKTATDYDKRRPTSEERFWAMVINVPGSECTVWTGAVDVLGYGYFSADGKMLKAHRYALQLKLRRPVEENLFACHRCDNPPCVNPDHLYEGTNQDNVNDMTVQRRHAWGMRNGHRRLTDQDVLRIRTLAAAGISQGQLAREYGVVQSTISRVVSRKRWALLA